MPEGGQGLVTRAQPYIKQNVIGSFRLVTLISAQPLCTA